MNMDNNLSLHEHLSFIEAVPEDIFEKHKGKTRRKDINKRS